jgi:hypothetical protein
MTGTVRTTTLGVTLNGNTVTQPLSARVSIGYDLSYAEATVVCASIPSGSYYDPLVINMNGSTRFSGVLAQKDFSLYPRAITLVGRGNLWKAAKYRLDDETVNPETGLSLLELLGASSGTDEEIVTAVLNRVGLSGSISGTGRTLGTIAPEEYAWRINETALDYIQRLDRICLGYRTFETLAGSIFRSQITSRPSAASSMTFEEGVDISDGGASRSVQEAFNAVRVGGYAVGDYLDPRVYYVESSNDFQGGGNPNAVFTLESPMIERKDEASAGEGISCEVVADYWLHELNREIVKVTLTTPRDDDVGPGQLHTVQGPAGAADRLGTGEKMWVQRVDVSIDQSGAFSQQITYIGGNIE